MSELLRWLSGKEFTCTFHPRIRSSWGRKRKWRRKWQPPPIFLPGKLHDQRSLEGFSPSGGKRVACDIATKQQLSISNLGIPWFMHYHQTFHRSHNYGHHSSSTIQYSYYVYLASGFWELWSDFCRSRISSFPLRSESCCTFFYHYWSPETDTTERFNDDIFNMIYYSVLVKIMSLTKYLPTLLYRKPSQVALVVKNSLAIAGHKKCRFNPWVKKIPWRRAWQPSPIFLPGESHGQRNLEGTVHRAAKSQTQMKQLSLHTFHMILYSKSKAGNSGISILLNLGFYYIYDKNKCSTKDIFCICAKKKKKSKLSPKKYSAEKNHWEFC